MTASSGGRRKATSSTRLRTARPCSRAGSKLQPRSASRRTPPWGTTSWMVSTAVTDPVSSTVNAKAATPPDWTLKGVGGAIARSTWGGVAWPCAEASTAAANDKARTMRQQEERAITSLHGEPPHLELDPPAAGRLSGNCILHRPFPSADSPGGTKEPQRTIGVRRRVDMRWQGALALTAAVAVGEGRAALAADTQRVIAGRPQYDRSGYFKWHFGEGYRKLWTAPFEAPVLDLKSYAGGLTPVRKVGSMQSIGLALKGADGKAYTFRT